MVPVAVITEGDVAQAVAHGRDPNDVRISDVVSGVPLPVPRETGVAEATGLMLSSHVHHLPVVDGARVVGIVDLSDVCRGLLSTPDGDG
jgi:CBS domain-containing protein